MDIPQHCRAWCRNPMILIKAKKDGNRVAGSVRKTSRQHFLLAPLGTRRFYELLGILSGFKAYDYRLLILAVKSSTRGGVMEFREQEFIPVLFGSDLGAYSMARAFYEEYGVKSQVYGKYVASPCNYSNIINFTVDESIEEDETFLRIVNELAASTTKKLVIFGFGDSYLRLVSRNKPQLPVRIGDLL